MDLPINYHPLISQAEGQFCALPFTGEPWYEHPALKVFHLQQWKAHSYGVTNTGPRVFGSVIAQYAAYYGKGAREKL